MSSYCGGYLQDFLWLSLKKQRKPINWPIACRIFREKGRCYKFKQQSQFSSINWKRELLRLNYNDELDACKNLATLPSFVEFNICNFHLWNLKSFISGFSHSLFFRFSIFRKLQIKIVFFTARSNFFLKTIFLERIFEIENYWLM